MHETAIARDIIAIVSETLQDHPKTRIKTVRVSIGQTIAVVPDLLQHAYQSLILDTPLQQSTLELAIIPISATCHACNTTFGLDEFEFLCPSCGSANIEVKTGDEFFIKELEVEPCP